MRDDGPPARDDTAPGAARRPAGALEAEVLAVLQVARGPLSPGQVRQRLAARLAEELSYSTVVTIMSRLHAKGLLARERSGRAFTYTPVDEANLAASRMSQALDAGGNRDAVLTRFASGLSGRDAKLLRRLLAAGQADPAGLADPGDGAREREGE